MKAKYLVGALIIASVPFLAETGSVQSNSVEPTLWGVYGSHNRHDCPVNNRESAKDVIAINMSDLQPLMDKYGVIGFVDQYHSGLEHTFLWAVETTKPHDLEGFFIELGAARWNDLKFVPLITFDEVVKYARVLHGLEDWEPEAKN